MKRITLLALFSLLALNTQAQQPKVSPKGDDAQIVTLSQEQTTKVDEIERQMAELQKAFEVLVLKRRIILLESGVSKELIDSGMASRTADGRIVLAKKP
jgi:hypothetical protein